MRINERENRIGILGKTRFGTNMQIIDYINKADITVKILDDHEYVVKTDYKSFIHGNVRNPYDKSIFDIGYIGDGKYKPSINRNNTDEYNHWRKILSRCYDETQRIKYPSYKNCLVCDEWHNFQNFVEWYQSNFYEIVNERMEIDKDILVKGNTIYSPKTCLLVPQKINNLFIKQSSQRGDFPIGVVYREQSGKYMAYCSDSFNNKQIYLGLYSTPEQAFFEYKKYKEKLIKKVADTYQGKISKRVYEAMYMYEVDIND